MAWTAPRTWVAGEIVTAALLNAHLRDDLLDLADGSWGRDVQFAVTTSNISTPLSGAFGNVTGFTFTTVAGGIYAIDCVMFTNNASSSLPGWRSGWSWTGTGTMSSGLSGIDTSVSAPSYNGPNTAHAITSAGSSPSDEGTGIGSPAAIPVITRVAATFVCTTAGAVQMRHAQATSNASFVSRVEPGSRMRAERIA